MFICEVRKYFYKKYGVEYDDVKKFHKQTHELLMKLNVQHLKGNRGDKAVKLIN